MCFNYPKISVVTPSFNQGQFIEQTIQSVLSQSYPNLEYIIMDGGSDDNTVEVIKKYENQISYWQSEKDNGQASAINVGFDRASGDIICWLNSDDIYMPGTLFKIAQAFHDFRQPEIVFGDCIHFNDLTKKVRSSNVLKRSAQLNISLCDFIIQPSSFFSRAAWEKIGRLNEQLHYTFDWDWFIRAHKNGVKFTAVSEFLSLYRIHEGHKSGTTGSKRVEELNFIVSTYNDPAIAKAFKKWMRMYTSGNLISKSIDFAQRKEIKILNSLFHQLFFFGITRKEYLSIVGMN